MRISGGTTFGYCAIGSWNSVTSPTITVRIESTIAKTGRLMKKRDMLVGVGRISDPPCPLPRCGHRRLRERLRLHGRALFHFLQALDHDHVVGLEALGDDPARADAGADLHRPEMGHVIRPDDGELVTALEFRHRALRHLERGV